MTITLPLIIEPDTLEPLLEHPDLLVVDVCQPQNWRQLHVPGAVHLDPFSLVCGTAPAPGKLPTPRQLHALFASIGYRPDQHIVVYDDEGGGWAGRFIWMLDVIGHTRYSYLNGGLFSWYKEEHPLSTAVREIPPTPVQLTLHHEFTASLDDVLNALEDPSAKIWDARSPEEYSGLRTSSMRSGHIPGAINLDWVECMDRASNMRLLPLPLLREKLQALGIHAHHHIITHCQSHHRSGLTYLVAKALGFRVQAYDGSWAEWGNLSHTPIEVIA
jgi:thiosulfate/3-mercaptopyruvate sulfurtransferase